MRGVCKALLTGAVTSAESLLLASAMAEARVVIDPAGNAKLASKSEGGRRTMARDDAATVSFTPS